MAGGSWFLRLEDALRAEGSEATSIIPVLGLPVRLETSDGPLRDAVLAAYADWSDAGVPPDADARGVTLRARLRARPGGAVGAVMIRAGASRLLIRGGGVRAAAFGRAATASCELDPHWLENLPRLKTEVLDTLLLFLLTGQDRVPLHGAALLLDDVAVVLAGRAGTGKSTLALAGVREGMQFLSEDAVYVETRRPGRVWGWPGAIHVAHSQVASLGGIEASGLRWRGGKTKAAVDPRTMRIIRAQPRDAQLGEAAAGRESVHCVAERSALFLLRRGTGQPSLQPVTREAAVAELMATIEPGFDVFRASIGAVVAVAGSEGCWRLTLGEDAGEAVALVQGALRQ